MVRVSVAPRIPGLQQQRRRSGRQGQTPVSVRDVGVSLLAALAYILLSLYANGLRGLSDIAPGYWPAAGVAVGVLLVVRRGVWPLVIATIVVCQLVVDVAVMGDLLGAGLWAVANVVGHVGAALLIVRWRAARLDDPRAVCLFLAACTVAAAVSAVPGVAGEIAAGLAADPVWDYAVWMLGDLLGMITVAPLVVALFARSGERADGAPGEPLAVLTATVVLGFVVFGLADVLLSSMLAYLLVVPLGWAAMRLGLLGAAATTVIVTQFAVAGTSLGHGQFAIDTSRPLLSMLLLELFVATVAATTLLVASRSDESRHFRAIAAERQRLLDVVSHELRTPLTPIIGFTDIALHRHPDLDDRVRSYLQVISRNAHHLTSLIDNLLQASRFQLDRVHATPQQLDLATALHELAEQIQDNVALQVEVDDHLTVHADPQHLTQIVTNLIDNAITHGAPPVDVRAAAVGDQLQITVTDHGDGISEQFLPQLFEPFAQQTEGDTRPTLGLGLGLPIAAALVAANDGTLHYDTDHTHGTRFIVTLPTRPAAPDT